MSSLSAGIVGLPNVGKSTTFNALLKKQVALAANYPFATIEPNTGVVPVPDNRLTELAKVVGTTVIKPATVEFLDIAGLVKGASQGEGLGNQFLAHIREVDVICHVVRGFSDEQVLREGSVDPASDKEIIETELLLADLATLEKQRSPKSTTDKNLLFWWSVVQEMLGAASAGKAVASVLDTDEKKQVAKNLGLLTSKPMIMVVNVDESELADSSAQAKYAALLAVPESSIVLLSAKVESELGQLDEADQKEFLADLGVQSSGLERLIVQVYATLGLQSYLTAGEKEVRAWTIPVGTKAPQAAGVIHGDLWLMVAGNLSRSWAKFAKRVGIMSCSRMMLWSSRLGLRLYLWKRITQKQFQCMKNSQAEPKLAILWNFLPKRGLFIFNILTSI